MQWKDTNIIKAWRKIVKQENNKEKVVCPNEATEHEQSHKFFVLEREQKQIQDEQAKKKQLQRRTK